MPNAPLRICGEPGCPELVSHGRCSRHERSSSGGWKGHDGTAPKRIAGRKLQHLRQQLFANEPFCRLCHTRVASIRDHIIPLAEGGTESPENIQPICQRCSDTKSYEESVRGRMRVQNGR